MVLLEALDGDADVELGVDGTLGEALGVVGLGLTAPVNDDTVNSCFSSMVPRTISVP